MEALRFLLAIFVLYQITVCFTNAAVTRAPTSKPSQTGSPKTTPAPTTTPTAATTAAPTAAPAAAPSATTTANTTTEGQEGAQCPKGTYDAVKDHAIFLFEGRCELHVMFTLTPATAAPATNAPTAAPTTTKAPAAATGEAEGTGAGQGEAEGAGQGGETEGGIGSMSVSDPAIMIVPVTTGAEAGGECVVTTIEKLATQGYLVDINMCEIITVMRLSKSGARNPSMFSRAIPE